MRVLALASYDSFLNSARLISPYYEQAGATVELALVRARMATQIETSQIDAAGLDRRVRWVSIEELCGSGDIAGYDIVLSCLEGLSTRRLMHRVKAMGAKRPLVVSIYPGLVLRFGYDGFSMRASSDFLWLNSPDDCRDYRLMCRSYGNDGANARVFGVAPVLQTVERSPAAADGPVVFFEQAIIPRYEAERMFLAEQLVALARRYPAMKFLVKPRTVDGQATLHQTWHPIAPLLDRAARKSGGWPSNLQITSERADRLLAVAGHCMTVSSTVAVEAIYAGVPTAIISDFGAHDDYGLQYFYGSGLTVSFAELALPFAGKVDSDWLASHAADPRTTVAGLVTETIEAASRPRAPVADALLAPEHSPALRDYLMKKHGVDGVLGRQYQKAPLKRMLGLHAVSKALRRWLARRR
jgi:hypothetical protein